MEEMQLPVLSILISAVLEEGKPKRLELSVFGRLPDAVTSLIKDFSTAGFAFEEVTEHDGMLKTKGSIACGDEEPQMIPEIAAWWTQYCQQNNG